VLENWEEIKRSERAAAGEDTSALAGVPRGLPALQRAGRMCQKAVAAGFHWEDARGALGKVEEELRELVEVLPEDALRASARPELPDDVRERVEHELGDLLMATSFLGGYLRLEPEALCRAALRRFEARFRNMEGQLGGSLEGHDLGAMMAAWVRAKTELADPS
jgi:ATP diphosphatase